MGYTGGYGRGPAQPSGGLPSTANCESTINITYINSVIQGELQSYFTIVLHSFGMRIAGLHIGEKTAKQAA